MATVRHMGTQTREPISLACDSKSLYVDCREKSKASLIGFGVNRFRGKKSRQKKKKKIKATTNSTSKKLSAEDSPLDDPSTSGSGGAIPPSEVPDEVKDVKQQAMDTALFPFFRNIINARKSQSFEFSTAGACKS